MDICFHWLISCVRSGQSLDGPTLEGTLDGSMYLKFLDGVPKWSGEFAIISARSGLPVPLIFLVVFDLISGLLFSRPLLSGGSLALLFVP